MKLLLIGLGGFGKNHLRVWSELHQDVFVSDRDAERLSWCETYHIPKERRSIHYEDLLDRVEAVDIVTPTDSHFQIAKTCLEAGKDVFIEKPMALTSEEAWQLEQLNARTQRIVQVGHIFRFNPASQYLKQAIAEGLAGRIRYFQGFFKGFKRMRTDVGVTQTDSIHFFDLFTWFLGQRPHAVTAITRDYCGRNLDDFSHVFLEYPDGALAHVESGYFDPQTYRHVTIIGERLSLRSDIVAQRVELFKQMHVSRDGAVTAVSNGIESPNLVTREPLELELRAFLESVTQRRGPLVGIEDGYVTLKIVEAAYESSRKGRRVPIEYAAVERHAWARA